MNQTISPKNNTDWGESAFWEWEGFNCHWRELGMENKNPLLFLHGFGASSSHWRYNANYFANKGFRVFSLDLIGFGNSEQPGPKKIKKLDNNFWAKQVAAFLKEVVDTQKNGKAVLVGNSLGGLVALTTATFNPELVKSTIAAPLPDPALISNIKRKVPRSITLVRNTLIKIFYKILPLEILIPFILRTKLIDIAIQFAYHHSTKKDKDLKKIIIEPAKKKFAPRALRLMCIGMATRKDSLKAPFLLESLISSPNPIPILVVWGRQDQLVPLKIGTKISKQYPWLKLIVFENTGHCPHDESPSVFNEYVLDWLKNNSGGNIK